MPYDTLVWGEEQAANGLTAVAAVGPGDYATSGDTITLKKGMGGVPILFALGSVSDTKPQGSAITPQYSNSAQKIHGPGAINFAQEGWLDLRQPGLQSIPLLEGETLTGFCSTTNVNEGQVVGANIGYGGVPPFDIARSGYRDIHIPKITVTSAAAVTYNSGSVALNSGAGETYWVDTDAKYHLLGVVGNISGATFGGILHVTGLGGEWKGHYPGIPINPLSAVTFTPAQPFTPFPEAIPFDGDSMPSVGMTATSAGAITFGAVIGRL